MKIRPVQPLIIVAGLVLWSIWPMPAFWALVSAYGIAWLLADRLLPKRALTHRVRQRPRALTLLALIALIAAPVLALYRQGHALSDREGLTGARDHLIDRLRIETRPAVWPTIAFADHPQRFYIYSPGTRNAGTRNAGLSLDPDLPALEGEDLGHGLFRVDFDPRLDPVPEHDRARLDASVIVDGRHHRRPLAWVWPEAHPRWLAAWPQGGLAATVSEETDEVFLIGRQGLEWRVPVGDGPTDVGFASDGSRLVISHRYSPFLLVLDPADGSVLREIAMPRFQRRLAVDPSGRQVAVAIGGLAPRIEIVDLERPDRRSSIPLEYPADWLVFGDSDRALVVATRTDRKLRRFENLAAPASSPSWRSTASLALGRPVVTLARHPSGTRVALAATDEPRSEPHRGNHFIQDQVITVDVASWTVVNRLVTGRRTPRQDAPGDLDRGAGPMGLTYLENGHMLIAFAGSEEVWRLDPAVGAPSTMIGGFDLDLVSPHGVADLGDGYWAATSPAGGAIAVYGPDDRIAEFIGVAPPDAELLSSPPGTLPALAFDLRVGERAFFEATRSGVSCQSCHLHADTDESPHDIGQQPLLPTLTVRGVTGTAPYLRDGSFPRIRDLDSHLAGDLYRGYRRYLAGRGALLERYVQSLPRAVNPRIFEEDDAARLRAGHDAFIEARCDLCHVPPSFTHLGQHPARSLFPSYGATLDAGSQLDTPSLIGAFARDHFLQDGRAHDLESVLTEHNAANRHGDSARLDADRRAALVRFLESL